MTSSPYTPMPGYSWGACRDGSDSGPGTMGNGDTMEHQLNLEAVRSVKGGRESIVFTLGMCKA